MNAPTTTVPRPNASGAGVQSASVFCEACGRVTVHRLLRARVGRGASVQGVARCRECRSVHPFSSAAPPTTTLRVVVSDGRASTAHEQPVAPGTPLVVGERFPDLPQPWRVQRLDGPDGRPRARAFAGQVATAWVVVDHGSQIPVSLVEGRRTQPLRLATPPERLLGVGDPIEVDGKALTIVALRAEGRTWRRLGDRFPAASIARLYTRRTVRPPAGNSAWSRDRGSSSSRARAISTSARSRSSPGASRR